MKRKYLIIMRNGLLEKRFVKATSVVLTKSYDSVMWLRNHAPNYIDEVRIM